jgi:uncharacterized protein YdeI (YjbR/CyaY-like superfamily)
MTDTEKVDAYIEKHEQWKSQMTALRKVMNSATLVETVRWGAPSYTLNGNIVAGIVGFKNHCAIWFQQGVFLKDKSKKLVNAQEGTTRGMRQWRFQAGEKVDDRLVESYVEEAIENEKSGKRITPVKKKTVIPPELSAVLLKDANLRKGFESLSPGRQREYAAHIGAAKQEKTRLSRLEKITPMLSSGVGLYDKYKDS